MLYFQIDWIFRTIYGVWSLFHSTWVYESMDNRQSGNVGAGKIRVCILMATLRQKLTRHSINFGAICFMDVWCVGKKYPQEE